MKTRSHPPLLSTTHTNGPCSTWRRCINLETSRIDVARNFRLAERKLGTVERPTLLPSRRHQAHERPLFTIESERGKSNLDDISVLPALPQTRWPRTTLWHWQSRPTNKRKFHGEKSRPLTVRYTGFLFLRPSPAERIFIRKLREFFQSSNMTRRPKTEAVFSPLEF